MVNGSESAPLPMGPWCSPWVWRIFTTTWIIVYSSAKPRQYWGNGIDSTSTVNTSTSNNRYTPNYPTVNYEEQTSWKNCTTSFTMINCDWTMIGHDEPFLLLSIVTNQSISNILTIVHYQSWGVVDCDLSPSYFRLSSPWTFISDQPFATTELWVTSSYYFTTMFLMTKTNQPLIGGEIH